MTDDDAEDVLARVGGHPDRVDVLHVEDDDGFADLTATALEREHDRLRVTTETAPADALDRLDDERFDCVVSDYQMPGTDGLELLRAVRADHPELPFVLFTAEGSEAIAGEAIAAGVTEYLQKGGGANQFAVLGNRVLNAVERYRAERSRAALRERFRDLVENAPYAVCIYSGEAVVYANEAFAELLGADDPAEIEGLGPEAFVAGEERPAVRRRFERVVDEETSVGWYRKRFVGVDERERTVECSGAPVTHDGTTGVQVAARDVTERVRRERELRRAKEKFRKVFEYSNDAIFLVDLAAESFLDVNAAACELLGYDREELLALAPEDIHPDDIGRVREEFLSEVREEGAGFTDGMTCLTKDGDRVPTEAAGALLHLDEDADRPSTMVATMRDVSRREAYREDLRRQTDRLEELVSLVSHDLRSPLTVAQGHLDLLDDAVEGGPAVRDHLDAVGRAHDRIELLVEELLALARDEETPVEVGPVALAPLVEDCRETVPTDGATVAVDADRRVLADERRLRHLVENLVCNAVEHGSTSPRSRARGDAVERDPDGVTVEVGELDDGTGFYVADDGPGIDPEERERVFDAGHSTAEDGTGLGLAIVERMAAAHGWTVTVTESDAGGARFEVTGVEFADD